MALREVVPGVYQLTLPTVNCFLLHTDEGNVLIDTGQETQAAQILAALEQANLERPKELLLTHCHPDHAGGAAALRRELACRSWSHPLDAGLIEAGQSLRPLQPAPGRVNRWVHATIAKAFPRAIPACPIDRRVEHGHLLPGGLVAIHAPGHTLGHLCYFWPERKVLVAGDVASHLGWLRPSPVYEDYHLGLESLRQLGELRFEVALFGHGTPIRKEAAARFRSRFGGGNPCSRRPEEGPEGGARRAPSVAERRDFQPESLGHFR